MITVTSGLEYIRDDYFDDDIYFLNDEYIQKIINNESLDLTHIKNHYAAYPDESIYPMTLDEINNFKRLKDKSSAIDINAYRDTILDRTIINKDIDICTVENDIVNEHLKLIKCTEKYIDDNHSEGKQYETEIQNNPFFAEFKDTKFVKVEGQNDGKWYVMATISDGNNIVFDSDKTMYYLDKYNSLSKTIDDPAISGGGVANTYNKHLSDNACLEL